MAPITAPVIDPMPPITTMTNTVIDRSGCRPPDLMPLRLSTKKVPATPATAPEITKATSLLRNGEMP